MLPSDDNMMDDRLLLRPFRLTDLERLHAAIEESVVELSRWMSWCHADYSVNETRSWLQRQQEEWDTARAFNFGVFDRQKGDLLGGCGINRIDADYRLANLGYWIRSSQVGNGYASDATRLLATYGFDRLNLERIEIVVAVQNTASIRVAEKAGAVMEGILRKRLRIHQQNCDAIMFSLVPTDFNSAHRDHSG